MAAGRVGIRSVGTSRWVALTVAAVLAAGCGGGSSGDGGTPVGDADASAPTDADDAASGDESSSAEADEATEPAEEPIELGEITLVRDEAAAVEATIGVFGGRLEAVGADGTSWVLEVPEGALPGDTVIRAVPATIDGLPFPTSTLMFEPSGLFFYEFATLTIDTAEEFPIEEQFMYAVDDAGSSFGAAPIVVDAETPTVLVGHFSGYGLAKATTPERAAMLERQAADAEARISSELVSRLTETRAKGETATAGPELLAAIERAKNEVVGPRLEAAGSSCEALKSALRSVLSLERQAQLLGGTLDLGGFTAMDVLMAALQPGGPCEEEAIRECVAAQDPSILVRFLLGVDRQRQLLGLETTATIEDIVKRAEETCRPATYVLDALWGDFTVIGTICKVGEPFTVQADAGYGSLVMEFTWSGDTGGSIAFGGVVAEADVTGSGTFTAEFADGAGTLSISTAGEASMAGMTVPSFVDSANFPLTRGGNCSG